MIGTIVAIPFVSDTIAAAATKTAVLGQAGTGRTNKYAGCELYSTSNVQTDIPLKVEVVTGTDATEGTSSAATPVFLAANWTATPLTTAKQTYTAEPTVLTARSEFGVHPSGGADKPTIDGREIESDVAKNTGLRITNPAGNSTVTVKGTLYLYE